MVKGLLADINVLGPVTHLVQRMQSDAWADFWLELRLVLRHFEDFGLTPFSTDLEIWKCCQAEELVFITNNRNDDGPDSLEATIRTHNSPTALPVFTIANLNKLRRSPALAERIITSMYEYLLRIDELRGTGRLFLP